MIPHETRSQSGARAAEKDHRVGPDFLCIGMQKAATSWLHDQLRSHDQIWLPPMKELHFFDAGFHFDIARRKLNVLLKQPEALGADDAADLEFYRRALLLPDTVEQERRHRAFVDERVIDEGDGHVRYQSYSPKRSEIVWYRRLFRAAGEKLTGDITPAYCFLPEDLISRIHSQLPKLKLLLIIRNPVDRAWSQLRMQSRRGGMDEANLASADQVRKSIQQNENVINRSYPTRIYQRWAEIYGTDAIGVFFFDDISDDPDGARAEICAFLGVDGTAEHFALDADYDRKAATAKPSVPEDVLAVLREAFAQEIELCKEMFGGRALGW